MSQLTICNMPLDFSGDHAKRILAILNVFTPLDNSFVINNFSSRIHLSFLAISQMK